MGETGRKLGVFIREAMSDEDLYVVTGCDRVYKQAFLKMVCREFLRFFPGKVIKYYYSLGEKPDLINNEDIMSQELTELPIMTGHIMLADSVIPDF